jgi:hypothetical protein
LEDEHAAKDENNKTDYFNHGENVGGGEE